MSNESRMLAASNESRVLKIFAKYGAGWVDAPIEIKPEHQLEANLGFDELDYIEVMIALEEEFDIHLDDEKFDELKTVQQVIDHITDVCTATETAGAA